MIPAALFAILAISRLGAIHTVVFGGFAPASLAQRIEASKPRAVMTASCGVEGAKGAMAYKPFIEGALQKSGFKPEKVIVWQREQMRWSPMEGGKGQRCWQELVKKARRRGVRAEAVPVKSGDGLYIIYTSGECASNWFTRHNALVWCSSSPPCFSSFYNPFGHGIFQRFASLPMYLCWSSCPSSFPHSSIQQV